MAIINVPAAGATVSGATLDDTIQAAPGVDVNGITVYYEVDGTSTLDSLSLGYDIEFDIGFSAPASLTGTGNITGAAGPAGGNPPLVDNYGTLDVNGTIGTDFDNDLSGQVTVAPGERLVLAGNLLSLGTITVAAGGELDMNSRASALLAALDVEGTLRSASPSTTLSSFTNNGAIDVTAGQLSITGGVQGRGTITVESGATLSIETGSSLAAIGAIALRDGATLKLATPSAFDGALQFQSSNVHLDLAGITATAATVSNGAIVVTTSAGSLSLAETGLASGTSFAVAADGGGGSVLSMAAGSGTGTGTGTGGGTGTGSAPGTSTPISDPVYRFFDTVHGTHFYTASATESATTQTTRPDLTYEGVGLLADDPASDPSAAPVYRFFDTKFGTHFYTSSATEKDSVIATRPDLTFEGVGFNEDTTPKTGDVAVYRYFDTVLGTHFYTSSAAEQASIAATRPDLVNEGIGFYAPTS